MRNAGRVVSKTMILSHVWEYSFDPQTNIVDVLVSRLREKIDRPFEKKLLHTVRGVGYVLGGHEAVRPFGLRLALWYATLFVVASIVIVFLTYWLTSASLAQRDQQIIQQKIGEYAAAYQRGGLRGSPTPSGPSRARRPNASSFAWSIAGPKRSCSANRKDGSRRRSKRRRCGSGTARWCRWGRAPKRGRICSPDSARRSAS